MSHLFSMVPSAVMNLGLGGQPVQVDDAADGPGHLLPIHVSAEAPGVAPAPQAQLQGELMCPVPAGDRPGRVLWDGVRGPPLVSRLPQQVRGHLGPAALRPEAHFHHW